MKLPKKKTPSVSKLKKKLDTIFSRFVRIRDKGQCYTCPTKKEIKFMDAGHYILRQHNMTRFDERNVHCQCKYCNMYNAGSMNSYAIHLIKDYGIEILDELEILERQVKQWKPAELQEKIIYYKEKVKEMEL